tara:strand:- start:14359 stop:15072 length:714 start_codon:yes stop_codon:yes gene_type:complete
MLKANTNINSKTDFVNGQLLLFDKPLNWTSFDLVKKIRNIIKSSQNLKKLKVGHAGTLDPLADGLLIICTGKLTKKIHEIQNLQKVYTGTITIGATTPSFDKETPINKIYEISHINEKKIIKNCENFLGEIIQVPPIFSAIKLNGKRMYEYARNGDNITVKKRIVTIHSFTIKKVKIPDIKFKVICSKGTYIRSLANDFGKSLNSGAYLSGLRREKIGEYNLKDSYNIESFKKNILL